MIAISTSLFCCISSSCSPFASDVQFIGWSPLHILFLFSSGLTQLISPLSLFRLLTLSTSTVVLSIALTCSFHLRFFILVFVVYGHQLPQNLIQNELYLGFPQLGLDFLKGIVLLFLSHFFFFLHFHL